MDPLLMIVVAAVAAGALYWWFRRRNITPPVEDEWQLPPETGGTRLGSAPEPQILDRDMLGGKRAFDPSGWDNTPDGAAEPAAEPEPGELPRFFDRDYLERKKRGEAEPS